MSLQLPLEATSCSAAASPAPVSFPSAKRRESPVQASFSSALSLSQNVDVYALRIESSWASLILLRAIASSLASAGMRPGAGGLMSNSHSIRSVSVLSRRTEALHTSSSPERREYPLIPSFDAQTSMSPYPVCRVALPSASDVRVTAL